ncbi:hypothetical protein F5Y09DRAFT_263541 [Xylaria sp. FL1042]|nr:hypothetical protein F5Y09DRAFT_263541 [Xylaria sp. FL1042]
MFKSRQTSIRGDNPQASRPDSDGDSASATHTDPRRKRRRLTDDREDQSSPLPAACNQCRLRKVRCDRLQPECSNCRKSGIECNSSNTLKRVNHVKQLRDDFSNVLKQLSDVDHALSVLTEITRQITARPCSHAKNPDSPPHSHDALPLSTSGLLDFFQLPSREDQRNSQGMNKPLSETVQLGHGRERLYSYPAPLVLIKSLFHQAERLLPDLGQQGEDREGKRRNIAHKTQDTTVSETLQRKLRDFPFISIHQELVIHRDASPLTTPPRLMVNLFINGYLQNINSRTPIFNDEDLYDAIDAHYSDKELHDNGARALIINNVILLELSLEIKTGRASRPNSRVPNNDILPSFLRNCARAIGNLDSFKAPTIISLQALMTLTLVAQEFYSNGTAERVCQAACQVGRIMGIHRSKDHDQDKSADTRGRLFRILYAMDKTRVFMTGQPCDLHLFDSDQHIGPDRNRQGDDHPVSDAFDHLMTIWEEIYLNLYSSWAMRSAIDARLNQMRFVTRSICRFSQTHSKLLSLSSLNVTADTDLLRIELLYGYQVSRILILRCDHDNKQSSANMRDLARSSLGLILKVCKPTLTTARVALLARMFRRYPIVAFVELVAFHLSNHLIKDEFDSTALADILLLRGVCNQLQVLQYDNLTPSFYTHMSEGLVWAVEMLEALTETVARPSSPNPQEEQDGSSQQSNDDNRESAAESPCDASPDMFDACDSSRQGRQELSQLTLFHNENSFTTQSNKPTAEVTDPGFLGPNTEPLELISGHSSPIYQLSSSDFGAPQSQFELASGPFSNDVNWSTFNLDFLQGTFAQGSSWD